MFTGLIEEIGRVLNVVPAGNGLRLTVHADTVLDGMNIGDSLCINGACQTVTAITGDSCTVFVSSVTSSITTLGSMRAGVSVNLERAMTPMSRFGGHFVQGHVDGKGAVQKIQKDPQGMHIEITTAPHLLNYIVEKGSVAVDGISLTIVSMTEKGFSLYIIPETLNTTIVSEWKIATEVNIEVDIIAKYVEKLLHGRKRMDNDRRGDKELFMKLMEEGYG